MIFVFIFLLTAINLGYPQVDLDEIEKEFESSSVTSKEQNLSVQLSLQDAIETGLRKNFAQRKRKYEFQINELTFKDAFEEFYLPNINLTMGLGPDHYVDDFYRDLNDNASSPRVPSGQIGIELKDYALFNWGRDYLVYLNAKETYERTKGNLAQDRRDLRLKIIGSYFNLARLQNRVKIYKKQLSHASFIYRLAKEKLTLRKIKTQEFLEAKALFLGAHKDFHEALYEYDKAQNDFTQLMGEDNETPYRPISTLKFTPLNLTRDESLKFALKGSRDLLNAQTAMNINNRSFEKTRKDNLPLPTFTVKLGSYQRNFDAGVYSDDYQSFNGSKNIELAATLNMTWTLVGPGGALNSRVQENAFYQKKMAELDLRDARRTVKYYNRITHSKIQRLEKKYKAISLQRNNARQAFDQVIDNYISGKTNITNVRQLLRELRISSTEYEDTKYFHLFEKLNLVSLMGVDDFPGESFERLVEK